ncbi:MAG TPA: hypothetical protein VFA20_26420 [Myxococcaceae bacterium]|nr:hypothetical protein [Myxococcaceae bacterium]
MRYLLLLAAVPQLALAAAVIRIDESRSLSIAVAFRSSMGGTNIPAQDGSSRALDLSVDGAVLAIGGELDKHLRLQINALRVPTTGAITVADAIVQVDVAPWLQVWAGRMLPPLDRASLTGPFFGVLYDPPVASAYPALLPGGRDDGVALWGTFLEGRLKYEAGGFRGRVGAPNLLAFPMFAARVSYSFWDPEPGYYASGTYLGARKTLTLAVHGRYQRDGVKYVEDGAPGRYAGFGADALAERDLGPVLGTLELGWAHYDASASGDPLAFEGTSACATVAGMWLKPLGIGRLQLGARYQWMNPPGGPYRSKLDGVLNYFIAGQSIRLVGIASREFPPSGPHVYTARFAVQLVL